MDHTFRYVTFYLSMTMLMLWLKQKNGCLHNYGDTCYDNISGELTEPYVLQDAQDLSQHIRRRLLGESPLNLAALPAPALTVNTGHVLSFGHGSFPATKSFQKGNIRNASKTPNASTSSSNASHSAQSASGTTNVVIGFASWKYIYILSAGAFLLAIVGVVLCLSRKKAGNSISPWKTGLSGQLQKAFVTGVPNLSRTELEIACEDFSNIISTLPECKVFKGTLSSGAEIAVACSSVRALKDWSVQAEHCFRNKVDTFSRVNHKNFINLIGYCEEDEPFLRAMVFEYAPSGTLFEHLHGKVAEHLDWPTRMRIIMGIAYCLQHLHHELYPPVAHPKLQSDCIFLTDDYASKVTEVAFWKDLVGGENPLMSDIPAKIPLAEIEANVYNFGILILEIVSGKLPYSEEQGSLVNWAEEYLNDRRSISYMIDPSLKSFKNNELDVICEVIQDCVNQDPKQRPSMGDATTKLKNVLGISADAAAPRLSPLWWAELEILSVEAT